MNTRMPHIFYTFVTLVILLLQYGLSRLRWWWTGAILPAGFFIFTLWCFILRNPRLEITSLWAFAVILVFLLGVWKKGRYDYGKKLEKELEKMKAQDIK